MSQPWPSDLILRLSLGWTVYQVCVLTWSLTGTLTWQGEQLEVETRHLFPLSLWRVNQFGELA